MCGILEQLPVFLHSAHLCIYHFSIHILITFFYVLEHLASYLNAYVNLSYMIVQKYLLNLIFIRNCHDIERKNDFDNLLCLNFYILYLLEYILLFHDFKALYFLYSYSLFLGLYFYGIYSKTKKA